MRALRKGHKKDNMRQGLWGGIQILFDMQKTFDTRSRLLICHLTFNLWCIPGLPLTPFPFHIRN